VDLSLSVLTQGINILTGKSGSGKTHTCQCWAEHARQAGWQLGGVISPAVFENGEKIAIDVVNLRTGETRRLANRVERQSGFHVTDHWDFSTEVMAWSNAVLSETVPCDMFIIDELGPLEFVKKRGWMNAIAALQEDFFQRAVVVIRPDLLEMASIRWPRAFIIDLETFNTSLRQPSTLQ